MTPQPPPFNYPWQYSPGASLNMDPNSLGGAMGPPLTQLLQQFAGPTNFMPHQTPAQAAMDQLAMRQYFNATQANVYASAAAGNNRVGNVFGGFMSLFTQQPLTDLNRQQANFAAGIANQPFAKAMIGSFMGPERYEELMFGTRGDPSSLANATNRIGYFRPDAATGANRISGQSLTDLTASVYANLYEPGGNIEAMVIGARSQNKTIRDRQTARLKKAARADHEELVSDDVIAQRIETQLDAEEVGKFYSKYRAGGTATTVAERAKELAKVGAAVGESGVLKFNETTLNQLQTRAEKASVESMHGFSAGKAGQVMEHLFQRGMLPQSIGALSAADRVKAIAAGGDMDDETLTRLATQFAQRELQTNNSEYRGATDARRQTIVQENLDTYKDRISESMRKIKAAGPAVGAEDAQRLLNMDGIGQVANNIDATRASQTVKKHTEALAAIREIFGDSGNPNAPVPALLAALDHLSQGAVGRTGNTGKVASTLREMRTMAKEMGMGFDQMAGLAAGVDAYGSQLGLSREQKLNATANAMAMVNNMDRAGAFADRRYGTMNREEATSWAAGAATRMQDSLAAKGAAAFSRAYAENKDKYEGTELGEIAKKMQDPSWDGSYTVTENGQPVTKNFFQEMGRDARKTIDRVAAASGAAPDLINAFLMDKMTGEYMSKDAVANMAKSDYMSMIEARGVQPVVSRAVAGTPGTNLRGTARGDAGAQRVSRKLTEMLVQSADMKDGKQTEYLATNLESEFAKELQAAGFTAAEAKAEAKKLADSMLGTTPEERKDGINRLIAGTNIAIESFDPGANGLAGAQQRIRGVNQLYNNTRRITDKAERAHQLGLSYQGTSLERFSDAMAAATQQGRVTDIRELLFETANIRGNSEVMKKIAPELQHEFSLALEQMNKAGVTTAYLRDLKAGKAVDAQGNVITGDRIDKEMRKLALSTMQGDEARQSFEKSFQTRVTDAKIAERRENKLTSLGEKDLRALYTKLNKTNAKGNATVKEMQDYLRSVHLGAGTAVEGFREEDLLDREKGEYSERQLFALASQATGARLDSDEFKEMYNAGFARFVGLFGGTEAETRAGLLEALTYDAKSGSYADKLTSDKVTELMTLGVDDPAADPETAKKRKKEFEEKLAGLGLSGQQNQRIRATFGAYNLASRIGLAENLTPAASLPPGMQPPAGAHAPGAPAPADAATTPPVKPESSAQTPEESFPPFDPSKFGGSRELYEKEKAAWERGQEVYREKERQKTDPAHIAKSAAKHYFRENYPLVARAVDAVLGTTPPRSFDTVTDLSDLPTQGPPRRPLDSLVPSGLQPSTDPGQKSAPAGPTPADKTAPQPEKSSQAAADLNSEFRRLTETVRGCDKPFKDLIDKISATKPGEKAAAAGADVARVDSRQQAKDLLASIMPASFQQRYAPAAPAPAAGSSSIRGTLTLVGLQSAVLAAKGSPMVSPAGGGPPILAGNPFPGPYASSAAVPVVG